MADVEKACQVLAVGLAVMQQKVDDPTVALESKYPWALGYLTQTVHEALRLLTVEEAA